MARGEGRHRDRAYEPREFPGASRTGAVLRGATCFHDEAMGLFKKQPDLIEWCPLCGAYRIYGDDRWTAPWLVAAAAIKAKDGG